MSHRSIHIRSSFAYICIIRCKLTTVDHKRGEFTGPEPLETLGKYIQSLALRLWTTDGFASLSSVDIGECDIIGNCGFRMSYFL